MAFETKDKDLLARIGRLESKSGTIETPLFFPVVNPTIQPISPREIHERFGCQALITNAYILKKRFSNEIMKEGLHMFLDFDGTIMTDSGAYQILVYGDIETTPKEIVEFQEQIDTDVATILDWPTGWKTTREHATQTVNETLKRAKELFNIKTRKDILWVGPVQGGQHLDLLARSARGMGRLPFQIHALGSPTEIMEHYRFDMLVDMIVTAKMNLPIERPLHLFGAGHPFMFGLAVALGCDFFDSAAYAIYAGKDRYMTEYGTYRMEELEYFPCTCPKCSRTDPKEVSEMTTRKQKVFLAEHNLYSCQGELKRIKQAIKHGRLWEHLELRAHGHPTILQAMKRLKKYENFIEKHSPAMKKHGIFFFDSMGLVRPEVVRHKKKLMERYCPDEKAAILLLIPEAQMKPSRKSKRSEESFKHLSDLYKQHPSAVHKCFYGAPFGLIPMELDEIYPLSQCEIALPLETETIKHVAKQVSDYIHRTNYRSVMMLHNPENWDDNVLDRCREICRKKNITFKYFDIRREQRKTTLANLKHHLHKTLSGNP